VATSLSDLQAYEAKLLKAIGDPTIEVWFDDFRKRMRPVSELQDALSQVRREISTHPDNTSTTQRVRRHLPRAICDL
jgi:hypothetical protein